MASAARGRRREACGGVGGWHRPDGAFRSLPMPPARMRRRRSHGITPSMPCGMAMFLVIELARGPRLHRTRYPERALVRPRFADPAPLRLVLLVVAWASPTPCISRSPGSSPSSFTTRVACGDSRPIRARRVLVPFIAALLTFGPACLVAWAYGWMATNRCTLKQILRLRFLDREIKSEILGPGHLWFLEYLLLMLAAYALFRWWCEGQAEA